MVIVYLNTTIRYSPEDYDGMNLKVAISNLLYCKTLRKTKTPETFQFRGYFI